MSKITFSTSRDQAIALGHALADFSALCAIVTSGTDKVQERGRVKEGNETAALDALARVTTIAPGFRAICQAVISVTATQASDADAKEAEMIALINSAEGPVKTFLERQLSDYRRKRENMAKAKAKGQANSTATEDTQAEPAETVTEPEF